MAELDVARLLQNPLGQVAPPGQRGDMVRVSDGTTQVYLAPDEFDRASEADLRAMLFSARQEARAARDARTASRSGAVGAVEAVEVKSPRRGRPEPAAAGERTGSLTAPRRVARRSEPLW